MPSSQRLDASTNDVDMRAEGTLPRRQRSSKRKNAAGMLESSTTLPVSLMLSSRSSKRQLSEVNITVVGADRVLLRCDRPCRNCWRSARHLANTLRHCKYPQRSLVELQHCNSAASEHNDDEELILATRHPRPSTLAPDACQPPAQGVPCRTVLCDLRDRVPASPSDKQSRIMDLRKATLLRAMQQQSQQEPSRRPLVPTSMPSPTQLDPICCSAAVGLGLCAMECASDCESEVSDMQMRDDCLFAMSDDEVGSVYVVGPCRTQRSAMAVAV